MQSRGEERFRNEPLFEIAWAFALPGQWTAIDPSLVDYDANTRRDDVAMECFGIAL